MENEKEKLFLDKIKSETRLIVQEMTEAFPKNEEIKGLKSEIEAVKSSKELDELKSVFEKAGLDLDSIKADIKALKENELPSHRKEIKSIGEQIFDRKEEYDSFIKSRTGTFNLEYKASHSSADIVSGNHLANIMPGVGQIPQRKPLIRQLFRSVPFPTEYLRYVDQNSVVRDAKNVAGCAASTHLTKVDWVTRLLQLTKVRDFTDICIDTLEHYDFVQAEMMNLINGSLQDKINNQLILGTGIHPELVSLDSISSTFNAANPSADFSGSIQAATIIDLIAVGEKQIAIFGQQGDFQADTIVMNPIDAFLASRKKDAENRLLNEMSPVRIIESLHVPANQAYLFDSTKAAIVQNKKASIEMSYENNSNFQTETVTIKAYEILNLWSRTVHANAFMHFPDIVAGVAAI